ncbi:MAG: ABC transporter permease [Anaerolineales bacterium]|jgi:NitT/TauT family transport system permease protein
MAIWEQQSKTEPEYQTVRRRRRYPLWTVPLSILIAYLLWTAASRWSGLPAFILPEPDAVAQRLWIALQDGTLIRHTRSTLTEVLGGLSLGFIVATSLGYLLAKSKTVERILSPYIVASQSIPVVAIAPLLVIWFGPGRISKVMISALIVFFPILINTIVGVRSVPQDLYDLMRSLRATRWQIFSKLEVPAALPVLLGGLKIGATLSVIGAVVGELVGSDQGLGFLINIGRGVYDTTLVYVAVITLVVLALALFTTVAALEWWFLRWREPS